MLGSRTVLPVEVICAGGVLIDDAVGAGGSPRGRVIEVFGPELSGKTISAIQVIALARKAGANAAFIDAIHAMDAGYAKKPGVDTDNLVVSQPHNGEQAFGGCSGAREIPRRWTSSSIRSRR